MKIHLGCGNVILPGFVNVDAVAMPGVDVVDDARTLSAFPHECADLIYASHILDHFSRTEIGSALAEWRRRLRPGGVLRLAVSDFAAVSASYQEGVPLFRLLGHVVGGHKSAHDRHGMSFDAPTLVDALLVAGFSNVRPWDWRAVDHGGFDDFSQAYEPHMAKDTGRLMSLNLEADCSITEEHHPIAWVIGDSHSAAFGGGRVHPRHLDRDCVFFDRGGAFGVTYFGPWLAWRLQDADRLARAMQAVETMHEIAPRPLVSAMGEIDCRTRFATSSAGSVDQAIRDTVERYTSALAQIGDRLRIPVAAWDPPPPTGGPIYNQEFPATGSYRERREVTAAFSHELRERCGERGLGFVSIVDRLVDGPERSNLYCFSDMIHLNPDAVHAFMVDEVSRWVTSL